MLICKRVCRVARGESLLLVAAVIAAAPLAVEDVNGTPWGWRVERCSPPGAPPPLLQGIGRVTGNGPRPGTGVDATATRRPGCGTARSPARRIAAEGEKGRMNGFAPRRAALSHTRPGPSNNREHWDESSRCQALSKFHRRQWITASKLGKPARNPDCATVGEPLAGNTVARPFLVVSLPSPEAYGLGAIRNAYSRFRLLAALGA